MSARFSTLILLAAATALAQPQQQPPMSPEVHPDRTVTFRVKAPSALKVELSLEGAPRAAMTKGDDGVWSITTTVLEPQIYGYTFQIDGTGFVDPANGQIKTNALSVNSAVLVPGETSMPWEQADVPHGAVHHHFYESKMIGDKRDFFVYTPPNWDPKKHYPLLVLLHGFSDYADGWTTVGKANLIFDNLIANGETKPLIVVMPLGYGVPIGLLRTGMTRDPNVWRDNGKKFGEALLGEVLPMAEKLYKISNKREQRAITGLSMGGGEALQVGLNHLEMFSRVGAFSAGGAQGKPEEAYPGLSSKDNTRLKLLWMACGKEDRLIDPNRKFAEWLKSKDIHYEFTESDGGHTWPNWRNYLAAFAKELKF